MSNEPLLLFFMIILDSISGEPAWLYRRIPHPVVLMGKLLSILEKKCNKSNHARSEGRGLGAVCLLIYLTIILYVATFLEIGIYHFFGNLYGDIVLIILASSLLAARSLYDHLQDVVNPLQKAHYQKAQKNLSKIVGRDVTKLGQFGMNRACIETAAENFSDGFMAPCFWFLVLGFPGLVLYKAINTADSMIGHKNDRYLHFGWAAARLDDLANYIPARLTAVIFLLCGLIKNRHSIVTNFKICQQQAGQHLSVNAGWPECAMASVLDIKLGGPRYYGDHKVDGVWLGMGREKATVHDVKGAINICLLSWIIFTISLVIWELLK